MTPDELKALEGRWVELTNMGDTLALDGILEQDDEDPSIWWITDDQDISYDFKDSDIYINISRAEGHTEIVLREGI